MSTSLANVSPSVIGTIVEGIARDPTGVRYWNWKKVILNKVLQNDHVDFDEDLIDDFAVIAQWVCSLLSDLFKK